MCGYENNYLFTLVIPALLAPSKSEVPETLTLGSTVHIHDVFQEPSKCILVLWLYPGFSPDEQASRRGHLPQ
jgi:hypothetical protein